MSEPGRALLLKRYPSSKSSKPMCTLELPPSGHNTAALRSQAILIPVNVLGIGSRACSERPRQSCASSLPQRAEVRHPVVAGDHGLAVDQERRGLEAESSAACGLQQLGLKPSITNDAALMRRAASRMAGKRSAQSWPLRVSQPDIISVEMVPLRTSTCIRQHCCLTKFRSSDYLSGNV